MLKYVATCKLHKRILDHKWGSHDIYYVKM